MEWFKDLSVIKEEECTRLCRKATSEEVRKMAFSKESRKSASFSRNTRILLGKIYSEHS